MSKRQAWPPPSAAKQRGYRVGILGPNTARCEKCQCDCSGSLDGWVLTGLCDGCGEKPRQERVAGQ